MQTLNNLYDKIKKRDRLSSNEALQLAQDGDFLILADLANQRSKEMNGDRVSYLIDRNINYTNVCVAICKFCAFYRPKGHREAWELTYEQIDQKIKETLALSGTQILMQGGIHPDYKIDYYINLVSHIKKNHQIDIHAFSPPEIHYFAKLSGLSNAEAISKLKEAGLNSIPGGGAEILVDEIRDRIAIGKCTSQEWLDVMEAAHGVGVRTTATMMFGHAERWEHRVEHMQKLRDLQDRTGGFISFIPWTFQPEHTAMNPRLKKNTDVILASSHEYLKLISIARLFLDNFKHIQTSCLTQGIKVGQTALQFGADDMGSVMLEENVVSSAGCDGAAKLEDDLMIKAILESGHVPYQRNTFYDEVFSERTQAIVSKLSANTRYVNE
jgi:cyclic dehypoxanthinyl futalosine synthase